MIQIMDYLENNSYPLWFNDTGNDFSCSPVFLPATILPFVGMLLLIVTIPVALVTRLTQKVSQLGDYNIQFTVHWTGIFLFSLYLLFLNLTWLLLRGQQVQIPSIVFIELAVDDLVFILITVEFITIQQFGMRYSPICIIYFTFRCLWLILEITLNMFITYQHGFKHQSLVYSVRFNLFSPLNLIITAFNLCAFLKLTGTDSEHDSSVLSFQNITFQSKILFHWFTKYVARAWRGHLTMESLPDLQSSFTSMPTTNKFAEKMNALKLSKARRGDEDGAGEFTHWELYKVTIPILKSWDTKLKPKQQSKQILYVEVDLKDISKTSLV